MSGLSSPLALLGSFIWHQDHYSVASPTQKPRLLLGNSTELKTRGPNISAKNKILASPTPLMAPLVAQMVKDLLALQETQVRSLSREDPLEKGMATHSNILAWRIPWTEEPGGL